MISIKILASVLIVCLLQNWTSAEVDINGGFENANGTYPEGWAYNGSAQSNYNVSDSANALDGNAYLELAFPSGQVGSAKSYYYTVNTNNPAVSAGDLVRYQIAYKDYNLDSNDAIYLQLLFLDGNNQLIEDQVSRQVMTNGAENWRLLSIAGFAPDNSNVSSVRLRAYFSPGADGTPANARILFDEAKCVIEDSENGFVSGPIIDASAYPAVVEVFLPEGSFNLTGSCERVPLAGVYSGLSNLTINGWNTQLTGKKLTRIFTFVDCDNVSLLGLTMDYDPLPFTQGRVVSVNGTSSFDVDIDGGYPSIEENDYEKADLYNPASVNDHIKPLTLRDQNPEWSIRLGNDPRKITVTNKMWQNPTVQVNDRIVLFDKSAPDGLSHAVYINRCSDMLFEDVTIHTSPTMAILEESGSQYNTYRRLKVIPGPAPTGSSTERLFSASGAGIRSIGQRGGPRIIDSDFEGLGDDCINIQGRYYEIREVVSSTEIVIKQLLGAENLADLFTAGDKLIGRKVDGSEYGFVSIQGIVKEQGSFIQTEENIDPCTGASTFVDVYETLFRVTLSSTTGSWSPAVGDLVYDKQLTGNGYVVRNSSFKNHRARGVLAKASQGKIEDCTFEGAYLGAIALFPEAGNFVESGGVDSVSIKNCTINDVDYGINNINNHMIGAICVSGVGKDSMGNEIITPDDIHYNLSIENVSIDKCQGPGLTLTSGKQFVVKDVTVANCNTTTLVNGSNIGYDPNVAVFYEHLDTVTFDNITISNPGVGHTSLTNTPTDVINKTDLNGGIH